MICPICEHRQESGSECETCGKLLVRPPEVIPAPEPLEGLAPTSFAPVPGPAGISEWVEETARPAVPDVVVEPIELERASAGPRPATAPTRFRPSACRYCRTPVTTRDMFCTRCGIRLG